MLILTRTVDTCICIGDDIIVKVLAINGHQVRIGVEAPRDVVIDRQEITLRKAAEALLHK